MERLEKLIELVRPYYTSDDPAHDWAHIKRVIETARLLASGEEINLANNGRSLLPRFSEFS